MRVLGKKIFASLLLLPLWTLSLHAEPLALDSNVSEVCRVALRRLKKSFDAHILSRPLFVKATTAIHGLMGPDPIISNVYIETRYIKPLRDKKHLSPSQVDEIITKLKAFILDSLERNELLPRNPAGDYKSLQFQFAELQVSKLEEVLAEAQRNFENYLDQRFPATNGSPSALDALKSIPGYRAPFGVGVASSMKEAGIAARIEYVQKPGQASAINQFADIQQGLFAHYQNTDKLRLKIMGRMAQTFGKQKVKEMLELTKNGYVFSTQLNSLMRKAESNEQLAQEIKNIFKTKSAPSLELANDMREYFNAIRVFEPPLEFLDSEIAEATDAAPLTHAGGVFRESSFIVSADIRDVGAYHATIMATQVAGAKGKTIEDFKAIVQNLTYGKSIQRLRDLLAVSKTAVDHVFNENGTIPSRVLGAKTSGDELVEIFAGQYDDRSLAHLLAQTNADIRLTIVKTEGLSRSDDRVLEQETNDLRHIGETMAKTLSEAIARRTSKKMADQFRFLVELSAQPGGSGNEIQAFVYHEKIPESLDQAARNVIKESANANFLRAELERRGIPAAMLSRITNFSFFQLPEVSNP